MPPPEQAQSGVSKPYRTTVDAKPLIDRMVVHVRDMRDHTDWGGYVVNEIVATHVSLASRPRRVAPLMAAAMYVNLSAGGNDRANRMLGAGATPQIQIAGGVRKVGLCVRSRQREDQCRACYNSRAEC